MPFFADRFHIKSRVRPWPFRFIWNGRLRGFDKTMSDGSSCGTDEQRPCP
jgi:hypothetical protein